MLSRFLGASFLDGQGHSVTIDDMLILETDPRREMGTRPGLKCCFKREGRVCMSSAPVVRYGSRQVSTDILGRKVLLGDHQ